MSFYGDWAVLCQRMDKLRSDPQVQAALNARFHYVRLDVGKMDQHASCRAQYGVKGVPHLIVFNSDGSVRLSEGGDKDRAAFLAFLARAQKPPPPNARPGGTPARAASLDQQLLDAAQRGEFETVKELIKRGAKLEATCPRCGATPLGHAALSGQYDIVKYLLDHGAQVNGGRHTALHRAAERGDMALAQLLLSRQANPNTRCPNCRATPLSSATAKQHTEMAALLRKHGARE